MKWYITGCLFLLMTAGSLLAHPLFDMEEIRDVSTLDVNVLQEWHEVSGSVRTRQRLIEIRVAELWPGQEYRVPVRLIVPAKHKAVGFHLTGSHNIRKLQKDARLSGIEPLLIKENIGLVYTIVQFPRTFGQGKLEEEMHQRYIRTMNPRYCIHYWGWAATLMRTITAAYAETEYFDPGKIAVSGGSKNGKSPTIATIHDPRITALHASVSPIWESPLRLCDKQAWDTLNSYNRRMGSTGKHKFLGGTFGPNFNDELLDAGHNWSDLQQSAEQLADHLYISRNFDSLKARGVDMLFHPGTHDFSACDLSWGGARYPSIPIYLKANSGHGHKKRHPKAETDEKNKTAFLLHHFFSGKDPLLEPPAIKTRISRKKLLVAVQFASGSKAESGRIWWMYDRAPDGSNAYIRDLIPDDQWMDMKYNADTRTWNAEIQIKSDASHIDLFSNHRKTITCKSVRYPTYVSSPYTRIELK